MGEDDSNGRATIREVYALLQAMDEKLDVRFAALDERYVWRDSCVERHRGLDPKILAVLERIDPDAITKNSFMRTLLTIVSTGLIASVATALFMRVIGAG